MNTSHYNEWIGLFPKLDYILSHADKQTLDKIDPADYIDHNLTRESEVICIIHDHQPQAKKWIRRYPNLKDLSPEDYAILDGIVVNSFIGDISEKDVRRIIEYRKANLRKAADEEADAKAKAYYAEHETEIKAEIRKRNRLSKISTWGLILGTALITAGCIEHSQGLHWGVCTILGISTILISSISTTLVLHKLNKHTVVPTNKISDEEAKLGFSGWAYLVCFYIGMICISIILGALLASLEVGWDVVSNTVFTSAIAIGAIAVFLFTLALVTSFKE